MIRSNGLVSEVVYTIIVLPVYLFIGISGSYVVFLLPQLDLPGSNIHLNDDQKSWIASSIQLLSYFGCLFSGTIQDLFGRKVYFFLVFIPQIISWIVVALATNYDTMLWGMVIQGISLGMSFTASTYLSEIALTAHRGAILGSLPITYNLGAMVCNSLMYYVSWNIAAWIFAITSAMSMFLLLFIPESPIWLYNKGKKERAIRTLCSLRVSDIHKVQGEIDDMQKSIDGKPKLTLTRVLIEILKSWKPLLIVVVLQSLMQNTGYTILFSYTILVFERLQLPSLEGGKFAIVFALSGVIGSICTPFLMYKLTRKTQLILSSLVMAICIIAVVVYEEIFLHASNKPFPYVVPAALYVFSFACNAGAMPIAYTIGAEIFPGEVRGTINGIFGVIWHINWTLIVKFYPMVVNIFGIKIILWACAVFCLTIILFGIWFLPETKGKTLNQVQEQYFKSKKKTNPDNVDSGHSLRRDVNL
ncbi:facilitated trehalose transporter Tret1-like isoform X2 [Planococcus citri]|uniref:facilitated trehalose transporter Tret1-like isoform X2 n=1 Tax=Planococcus citri TaxID=170843 RepID=UPI0031F7381A